MIFKRKVGMRQYKEFKKVFSQIKKLDKQNTLEELDMAAGFLLGVASEKEETKKITAGQYKTLVDMIEAIHNEKRTRLEKDEETAPAFIDFDNMHLAPSTPGFRSPAPGQV